MPPVKNLLIASLPISALARDTDGVEMVLMQNSAGAKKSGTKHSSDWFFQIGPRELRSFSSSSSLPPIPHRTPEVDVALPSRGRETAGKPRVFRRGWLPLGKSSSKPSERGVNAGVGGLLT